MAPPPDSQPRRTGHPKSHRNRRHRRQTPEQLQHLLGAPQPRLPVHPQNTTGTSASPCSSTTATNGETSPGIPSARGSFFRPNYFTTKENGPALRKRSAPISQTRSENRCFTK